ncbi:two-component system, sensor histidine kinase LadS [Burkholderiaceae bacterium]|nr:two-component system, sensor histidine kinase LadS [Burkholderiaceae bacterium]
MTRATITLLRSWLVVGMMMALAPILGFAAADKPMLLDDAVGAVDAWPAVKILADPSRRLSAEEVQRRLGSFERPNAPYANLGVRRDAVWLHVPVRVPDAGTGEWVFDVDYASLDRIDLYVITAGVLSHRATLGRKVPRARSVLQGASHAAALKLAPGLEHDLLVRVESTSSMILPVRLSKQEAFHARSADTQMLQGVLAGVGLCLVVYSLAQWLSLRDPVFGYYALMILGSTLFNFAHFGLAPQHLWGGSAWLTQNSAPLLALLALVGCFPFVERALGVAEVNRVLAAALRLGAAAASMIAIAFVLGVVDYRGAHLAGTILGPLPMVFAVPVAFARARRGERVGQYMLLAWGAYAASALTMVALLRGLAPASFWPRHAFQIGSVFESVVWMAVLGVRIEEVRRASTRARLERDQLKWLAMTDPLTSLPNRRGLLEILPDVMSTSRPDQFVAVFLMDLDGFKAINDELGHDAGDQLLVAAARRLESALRQSDTVARLGGDEFVVIAAGLAGDGEAQRLGHKLLSEFLAPFDVGGQQRAVGLTIGYALAPTDGHDAGTLLKRADEAMYAGKRQGGHCLSRCGFPPQAFVNGVTEKG